jgi:hypothetical protein
MTQKTLTYIPNAAVARMIARRILFISGKNQNDGFIDLLRAVSLRRPKRKSSQAQGRTKRRSVAPRYLVSANKNKYFKGIFTQALFFKKTLLNEGPPC